MNPILRALVSKFKAHVGEALGQSDSHPMPTAQDVGALPTSGGSVTGRIQLVSGGYMELWAPNGPGWTGRRLQILPEEDGGYRFNSTYSTGNPGPVVFSGAGPVRFLFEGNLDVTGDKNAVVETDSYGTRALHAYEMPQAKFRDEGIGTLVNGECRVDLDPIFLECIETSEPYIVHLTCAGETGHIRAAEVQEDHFIVRSDETQDGAFYWSVSAVRKGRAGKRFIDPTAREPGTGTDGE